MPVIATESLFSPPTVLVVGPDPHLVGGMAAVVDGTPQILEHFRFPVETHPVMGSPTLNVGTIRGGLNTNSVPDSAKITVDIRTVPGIDHTHRVDAQPVAAVEIGAVALEQLAAGHGNGRFDSAAYETLALSRRGGLTPAEIDGVRMADVSDDDDQAYIRLRAISRKSPVFSFKVTPRAARGVGCVEAPRGTLLHDYTTDADGMVQSVNDAFVMGVWGRDQKSTGKVRMLADGRYHRVAFHLEKAARAGHGHQ